jgi:hypothetical protein
MKLLCTLAFSLSLYAMEQGPSVLTMKEEDEEIFSASVAEKNTLLEQWNSEHLLIDPLNLFIHKYKNDLPSDFRESFLSKFTQLYTHFPTATPEKFKAHLVPIMNAQQELHTILQAKDRKMATEYQQVCHLWLETLLFVNDENGKEQFRKNSPQSLAFSLLVPTLLASGCMCISAAPCTAIPLAAASVGAKITVGAPAALCSMGIATTGAGAAASSLKKKHWIGTEEKNYNNKIHLLQHAVAQTSPSPTLSHLWAWFHRMIQ